MRVVAMFRVSTEKQANEGASLDAQQRIYREHAQRSGWETVAEFKGCESATQAATDRRVLQQVLDAVRNGGADAIYVHEQSRLTRGDELEVALLMRELREQRMKIIVNGVVRDLSSIDERFMVGIQSLVDRAESERIKERMGRGKKERARQGKKSSGPTPFGYRNPRPGEPGRGTLQVVPEQAVVVRRLFELAARGKGDRAIAAALNAAGMAAPKGNSWGKSTVRRVLSNPAYLGTAAANVWVNERGSRTFRLNIQSTSAIIVENAHEAIIDRDLWDAANGRPKRPTTGKPRLLTGMLTINGEPASGDSDHGRRFYRGVRGSRGKPWLPAEDLDEQVWGWFLRHATGPDLVAKLMEAASTPKERAVLEQEVAYLEEQIEKGQRRLERLVDMRADGEIGKDDYLRKSGEAKAALDSMTKEAASLRGRLHASGAGYAEQVVRAVQALVAGKARLTVDQRRDILASIVRRVNVAAVATGATQGKAEGGKFAAGKVAKWAVTGITFEFAIPDAPWGQNASGANVGQPVANGAGGHNAAEGDSRTRQWGTTPSCWGRRARARR